MIADEDLLRLSKDDLSCSIDDLTKPIKRVEEKWKLLPHFLRMRGLMRQHIDSFNHFINTDLKQIIQAKSNNEIRTENDENFVMRYTNIYVDAPSDDTEEQHPFDDVGKLRGPPPTHPTQHPSLTVPCCA